MNTTVFIRNLPGQCDSSDIKAWLRDDPEIAGIRIDNGTAEVRFHNRESAQDAAEVLNGKTVLGNKLKAAIVGELNASLYNRRPSLKTTKPT
mmetsp:Transcript_34970/g.31518  ORF Transcript_34970/g.31518 Transcript_34970/m.31518 type:complete len:92 (+) Transcript_34970:417-692(+)